MRSAIFFVISIILVSCEMKPQTPIVRPQEFDQKKYIESLNPKSSSEKNSSSIQKTPIDSIDTEEITIENPIISTEISDTIQVKITYGNAQIKALKKPNQPIVFVFDSDTAHRMNLKVTAIDSLSNLIISEISDRAGNTKPLFSQSVENFIIENKGIHQIKVEQNQSQTPSWQGEFSFEVELKW